MLPKWELISDCIAGADAVRKRGTKYLPKPNPLDTTPENDERYIAYITRAVFYNVVANTIGGLVGQVFNADPVTEYPEELEPMWWDATGSGITLVQLAKKSLVNCLAFGRCGLLVDFPPAAKNENGEPRPFSRLEVMQGSARPTIQEYGPRDVINWRFKMVNALSVLSMVVLSEDYIIRDDGFEITRGREQRVLKLDEANHYIVETWRRTDEKQEGPFYLASTMKPTDGSGVPFGYIPFYFIGAQNNDATVDKPPMYDMAILNIGHYRNSADYEDSVYMVGQPTPYFSGLTQQWVDDVLKGTIQLGSRGAVPLPEGGSAGLIQAEPNSMVKEAMDQKQQQMIALGAQLVEDKQVARTLGEAQMERAVIASVLSSCAHNVSQAFESAMLTAASFSGVDVNADKIVFQLSTDFAITKLSGDERRQMLAEWQGGLLSFSEARAQLRQSGIASLDDEVARAEIDKDQESAIDLEAERVDRTTPDNPAVEE